MKPKLQKAFLTVLLGVTLMGCASNQPPMAPVDHVNIEKFMGPWYVIAYTPTFIDNKAYNAIEAYKLNDDGTIATTYTFNNGAADGPLKKMTPKGFVKEGSNNALWGMQFIWPIKADYRIIYLDDDYTQTIIGRQKRDMVWIMARTPEISEADYAKLKNVVLSVGYTEDKLKMMPQPTNIAKQAK